MCRGFHPAVTPFSAAVEAATVGWLPWHVAELEHDAGSDGGDEERVGDDEEKRQRRRRRLVLRRWCTVATNAFSARCVSIGARASLTW